MRIYVKIFASCLRNYECSEQLAKQEVTSIFRALNRNGSDTSSDTYCIITLVGRSRTM
uniref:Uncharacterized protein n=1 Tax=Siphoviridae sp. ctEIp38 TaxID=2825394 RepID=A0A8S5QDC3_9CAUD|nr:MAG TPA: hypothetical protein [Siphoviridae sp. ctEIp38]